MGPCLSLVVSCSLQQCSKPLLVHYFVGVILSNIGGWPQSIVGNRIYQTSIHIMGRHFGFRTLLWKPRLTRRTGRSTFYAHFQDSKSHGPSSFSHQSCLFLAFTILTKKTISGFLLVESLGTIAFYLTRSISSLPRTLLPRSTSATGCGWFFAGNTKTKRFPIRRSWDDVRFRSQEIPSWT